MDTTMMIKIRLYDQMIEELMAARVLVAKKSGRHPGMITKSRAEIPGWMKTIRKPIMSRDNYKCRICHKDGGETVLHVHHIDYNRGNNSSDNLVTVCSKCHHMIHNERYKPAEYEDWPPPWGEHPVD